MIAYKGFNKDLESVMGDGKKETCRFKAGETKEVSESKTVRSGFHCCEYPFECLTYYPMNGKNRFFEVEASGDIDEDETRIACTRITLKKELTPYSLALAAMRYMIMYQSRKGWETERQSVKAVTDEAVALEPGNIAIARGENPRVKGPEGSILGLLKDNGKEITGAALFVVDGDRDGRWMELDTGKGVNKVKECTDERESD